jgi:serine/threonine protein kinase
MLSIAHRDIKPQNILVDKFKHLIVISDFGSAKQLIKGIFFITEASLISLTFARDVIVRHS